MAERHSGSCLCGKVLFTTKGALRGIIYCHCSQCRKQTGHFVAATASRDEHLVIEGGDNVTWYAASPDALRGFCKICGSLLFWKSNGKPRTSIMAGAFDRPSSLAGQAHIFVGDKGDYYEIDDGLPQFETYANELKPAT